MTVKLQKTIDKRWNELMKLPEVEARAIYFKYFSDVPKGMEKIDYVEKIIETEFNLEP